MSGLPEILCRGTAFCLPLTNEAATCLAGALLAPGRDARLGWLSRGLLRDPPLALWCSVQCPTPANTRPTLSTFCEWLAGRLSTDFGAIGGAASSTAAGGSTSIAGVEPSESERPADRYAELLARSRAVACAASEVRGVDADTVLLALVHRAVDWLMLAAEPPIDADAARAMLPAWLSDSLDRIARGNGPAGSAEERVCAAIASAADDVQDHAPSLSSKCRQVAGETDAGGSAASGESLAMLLPQMAARLARLDELENNFERAVEQAKLEALKEFAYGAGHEINNPLANISARAQTLLKDEADPERRQKLAAINTQAFRAHEMIADLMLFARPPIVELKPIALAPYLAELAGSWQAQAAGQQTKITVQVNNAGAAPREQLAVMADRSALAVALRALVTNALEALARGGEIEILAQPADTGAAPLAARTPVPAGEVAIRIRDNGPGIPPDVRARMFDPYFSGREAGRGLGFGLCKCWRIVNLLGGHIDVASDVGAGATFTIFLPGAPAN